MIEVVDYGSDEFQRREFNRAANATTVAALRLVCAIGCANAVLQLIVTALANRTVFALAVAGAWVALWWLSMLHASRLMTIATRSPWVLVAAAAVGMAWVAFDHGLDGTLATQPLWLTWVAAISVAPRMALAVAVTMSAAAAVALAGSGMNLGDFAGADRFQATLLIFSPLLTAAVGLALVGVFRFQVQAAGDTLVALRAGAPASTPALTRLLQGHDPLLLTAGAREELTKAEREVVEALRDGRTPKQIAHDRGRSLATVRTQIKHAKRKVGARTVPELIARTCATD